MNFSSKTVGTVTVASVAGEIDLQTSGALRKELMAFTAQTPLVIDLSGVTYMDSSGVASLVEALQTSKKANMPFFLAAIGPDARRILELARLDKVFPICDTIDDAITACGDA